MSLRLLPSVYIVVFPITSRVMSVSIPHYKPCYVRQYSPLQAVLCPSVFPITSRVMSVSIHASYCLMFCCRSAIYVRHWHVPWLIPRGGSQQGTNHEIVHDSAYQVRDAWRTGWSFGPPKIMTVQELSNICGSNPIFYAIYWNLVWCRIKWPVLLCPTKYSSISQGTSIRSAVVTGQKQIPATSASDLCPVTTWLCGVLWHPLEWLVLAAYLDMTKKGRTQGGGVSGLQPPPNSPKPKFKRHGFRRYYDIKLFLGFPLKPKSATEIGWRLVH
jgi:hypothetical protein